MVDRVVAEFIDNLPDGDRSDFVSAVLVEGIRRRPQTKYIEIRLTPDQLELQEEINGKCKGVWHPNPDPYSNACIIGVSPDTDTAFLDNLGVEYKRVQ